MDSGLPARPKLPGNSPLVVICVCYLAVAAMAAWNAAPLSDEGWFASPPYNLIHHGHFGTTTIDPQGYLLRSELTHINQRTYWVMPLHLVAQTAWYAVFGFGLVQLRLLTALFGMLGIIALYRWMLRLTGDQVAAAVAALLMAQDNILLWRSANGRMDVMCMSLGLMGQAAYLAWRERDLGKAILFSNAFLCLAGLTHPNGIILFLCLAATVLVLDAGRLRLSHLVPFAIPYLVGAIAYGAFAMVDLAGFKGQMLGNRAGDRMVLLTHPLTAILEELDLYKRVFIGSASDPSKFAPLKIILLITWVGGYLGQALIRPLKGRASLVLVLCGAIPVVVLTFFNARNDYYFIFIVPYFAASAGTLFAWLWRRGLGMRRFAAAAAGVTVLLSVAVMGKRIVIARQGYQDYKLLSAEASRLLPPGAHLNADAAYAFGVGFERVVQDDNLGFKSHTCPAVIIDPGLAPDEIENLRREAPDVLEYRTRVLADHYKKADRTLYLRVSCPPGTHPE